MPIVAIYTNTPVTQCGIVVPNLQDTYYWKLMRQLRTDNSSVHEFKLQKSFITVGGWMHNPFIYISMNTCADGAKKQDVYMR